MRFQATPLALSGQKEGNSGTPRGHAMKATKILTFQAYKSQKFLGLQASPAARRWLCALSAKHGMPQVIMDARW
jgi:hypothetical protein